MSSNWRQGRLSTAVTCCGAGWRELRGPSPHLCCHQGLHRVGKYVKGHLATRRCPTTVYRTSRDQDAEHEQQVKAPGHKEQLKATPYPFVKFTFMKPCLTKVLGTEGLTCFVICTRLRLLEAAQRHRGAWMELAAAGSDLNSKQLIDTIPHTGLSGEELSGDEQLYKESRPQGNHPQTL